MNDDREMIPRSEVRDSSDRNLYLIVGAIVVLVLTGAYVAVGTPGLHTQIAKAPTVDQTVEQTR
jgi:hypothetical protein